MKINKRHITGTVMTAAGILLVVIAVLLYLRNISESRNAEKEITDRLPEVCRVIEERRKKAENSYFGSIEAEAVKVDGYEYIGILSIPSEELEMPVFSSWSEEKLKQAPCCYYGSAVKGDLVIAGHNYSSGFGKLEDIKRGENVYFTDMNGKIYSYTVSEIEVLEADDVFAMINSSCGLSLYTCTYSGKQRLTIRCSANNTPFKNMR